MQRAASCELLPWLPSSATLVGLRGGSGRQQGSPGRMGRRGARGVLREGQRHRGESPGNRLVQAREGEGGPTAIRLLISAKNNVSLLRSHFSSSAFPCSQLGMSVPHSRPVLLDVPDAQDAKPSR